MALVEIMGTQELEARWSRCLMDVGAKRQDGLDDDGTRPVALASGVCNSIGMVPAR